MGSIQTPYGVFHYPYQLILAHYSSKSLDNVFLSSKTSSEWNKGTEVIWRGRGRLKGVKEGEGEVIESFECH